MTIPKRYIKSEWINTTAVDIEARALGLGFIYNGSKIFLSLDIESAKSLKDSLTEHLSNYESSNLKKG